jgi:hypothetical protein
MDGSSCCPGGVCQAWVADDCLQQRRQHGSYQPHLQGHQQGKALSKPSPTDCARPPHSHPTPHDLPCCSLAPLYHQTNPHPTRPMALLLATLPTPSHLLCCVLSQPLAHDPHDISTEGLQSCCSPPAGHRQLKVSWSRLRAVAAVTCMRAVSTHSSGVSTVARCRT